MKRFSSVIIALTLMSSLTISSIQKVKAETEVDAAFNGESVSLDTGITPNPYADYDWQAETCVAGMGSPLGFRVTAYVCDNESVLGDITESTDLKSWIQDENNRRNFRELNSSGTCFYIFNKSNINNVRSSGEEVYFFRNTYKKGTFPSTFLTSGIGSRDIMSIGGNNININGNSYKRFLNDDFKIFDLSSSCSIGGQTVNAISSSTVSNLCNSFYWDATNVTFNTDSFDNILSDTFKSSDMRENIAKRLAVFNSSIDWDNSSILLYFEPMISMEIDVKGAIDTNNNNVYEPDIGDTQETKFCFGVTPSDCAYITGTSVSSMYNNGGNMHTDNIFYGVTDLIKTFMASTRSGGTSGDSSYDGNASSNDIHDVAKSVLMGSYGAVSEVIALKDKPHYDDMWETPPAIQLFDNGIRQKSVTINKNDWADILSVLSYAKGLTTAEPTCGLYNNVAVKLYSSKLIEQCRDAKDSDGTYNRDYLDAYSILWDRICSYYKNYSVTLSGSSNTVSVFGDISRTEIYSSGSTRIYSYSGVSKTIANSRVDVSEYQIYNAGEIVNGGRSFSSGGQITSLTYGDLLKNPYNYYGIKDSSDTSDETIARPIINVIDENNTGDGTASLTISDSIYNDVWSCYMWMRGWSEHYDGPLRDIPEVVKARRCYKYLHYNGFQGSNKESDVINMTLGDSNSAICYFNAFECGVFRSKYTDESGNEHNCSYDTGEYRINITSDLNVYGKSYEEQFKILVLEPYSPRYYMRNIYKDCAIHWDDWLEEGYEAICRYYDGTTICNSNSYNSNLYTRRSTNYPSSTAHLTVIPYSDNRMGSWYRTYENTDINVDNVFYADKTTGNQRNSWRCNSKIYVMKIKNAGELCNINAVKDAIKNRVTTYGNLTVGDLLRDPYGYGMTYNSLEAAPGTGLQLESWAWQQVCKTEMPGVDSLTDFHDLSKLIAITESENKHSTNCEYTDAEKSIIQATLTRQQSDASTSELSSLFTKPFVIGMLYPDTILQKYSEIMNDVGATYNWPVVKNDAIKMVNASTAKTGINHNDLEIPVVLKKKDGYGDVKDLVTDTIKIKGIPSTDSIDLGLTKLYDTNKTSWGSDAGYRKTGSLGNNSLFTFRCVYPMTANITNNRSSIFGFGSIFGFSSSTSTKPTIGLSRIRDNNNTVWAYSDEWDKLSFQNTISVSYKGVPRLSGDWSTNQTDVNILKDTNIPVSYAGQVVPMSVEETNSGDSSYKNKLIITMYGLIALDRSGYATEFRDGYQTIDDFKAYVETIANDIRNNSKLNIVSTLSGIQTDSGKNNLGVQFSDGSQIGNIQCSNGDLIGSVMNSKTTYQMKQLEGRFGKNSINSVNLSDYGVDSELGSSDAYLTQLNSLLFNGLGYNDWLYEDFEGFALVKAEVVVSYGTKNYNITISKSESDSVSKANELYIKTKSTIDGNWKSTFGLNVHNDNEMNAIMPYIDLSNCNASFNLPSGAGSTTTKDLLGNYVCGCTTNLNVRGSIYDNDNRR